MIEPLIAIQRLATGTQFCSGGDPIRSPTHALNQEPFDDDHDFFGHLECTENVPAQIFEYRGEKVAGFNIKGRQMICLPQVYELFLKQLVGGLHTVYTKLKRLQIQPLICNVEQVRALRSLGAIQPGVNRCKLIDKDDFDKLYDDCTNSGSRPGRPPKRTPTEEWSTTCVKKERIYAEMNPSTSSVANTLSTEVAETQKPNPTSASNAEQMQQLFGNLLSPMTAQQLIMQQMMAVAMASHTQTQSLQNPQRPLTQFSDFEWSQNDDTTMTNETENGCKIFVETPSEFNNNNRPHSSENAAPLNLTKFQDSTQKKFLTGQNDREKSNSRSVDPSENGKNGNTPSGNNSETDDSFEREKSLTLSNDRSGSSSQRSPSETDQAMQFVVSKISSLIESAENSFKSHHDKLNTLASALQSEIKEMRMREAELEKKYVEERHRARTYFRHYTLMKHETLTLKQRMAKQTRRLINKRATQPK